MAAKKLIRFLMGGMPLICMVVGLLLFGGIYSRAGATFPSPDFPPPSVGLNKFDLALQYLGRASGGKGQPQYIRVERAMARKAIADAQAAGVRYFRVAITGYGPSAYGRPNDLELWLEKPNQYWADMDSMMSDLKSHHIEIVPVFMFDVWQFPAITHETIGDLINNPQSKSWRLLSKYVEEFITRYRGKHMIYMYEMTNEMNLLADLNIVKYCQRGKYPSACGVRSNFTSQELIKFTQRFYDLIKSLDPSVPVSTGFSRPRPSAEHLEKNPAFIAGKPDWTADSLAQSLDDLAAMNKYADVISVHIYPHSKLGGISTSNPTKLIKVLENEAKKLNKPLFIGEFGAKNPNFSKGIKFIDEMLTAIRRYHVPYSALWVWEFYQKTIYSTYDTAPDSFNLEPGYTDSVIEQLRKTNAGFGFHVDPALLHPIVVITYPLDCQNIKAPVMVHAVASANGSQVTAVKFALDNDIFGSSASPPYRSKIPRALLAPGKHELTAFVYASSGQSSHYSTTIEIGRHQSCTVPAP